MKHEAKRLVNLTRLDEALKSQLVHEMPREIRYELVMSMYNGAARQIDFFNNAEISYIINYLPRIRFEIVGDAEYLYKKGEYPSEIYFLASGRVNYLYGRQNIVFKTMIGGSYFGEIEIFEEIPREFSIMSEGLCEIFKMPKRLIDNQNVTHPNITEQMK